MGAVRLFYAGTQPSAAKTTADMPPLGGDNLDPRLGSGEGSGQSETSCGPPEDLAASSTIKTLEWIK